MPSENLQKTSSNEQTASDDNLKWRYQDKTYNELFKDWRRKSKDNFGFYYTNNPNEIIYRDGYGFVKSYPEAAERHALKHACNVVGVTMLIFVAIRVLLIYIMPLLLNKPEFDIYYDYYTGNFYGNSWLVVLLEAFCNVAARIIPFFYCFKKMKMPLRVMVPAKVSNKELFKVSVPAILMVVAICTAASWVVSVLLEACHIQSTVWITAPTERGPMIFSIIFNVLVIPVVSEIFTRGAIMQLLRQFGDGYAIIFTALLTASAEFNINRFCYMFIAAVVIGYFTVRTGSVITAVIMRVVSRGFAYLLYAVGVFSAGSVKGIIAASVMLAALIIGLVSVIHYMIKYGDKFGMKFHTRYLSLREKCTTVFTSVPMVLGFFAMLIQVILNLKIEL